jgi:flavorubredoxin
MNYLPKFKGEELNMEEVTLLFEEGDHKIYWLGIDEETAFRINVYLIQDGDEYIIVDPGSRSYFEKVKERVAQIVDPSNVENIILCHQDPDVAASMIDWLRFNRNITIHSSARTNVLLPHYGEKAYAFNDTATNYIYTFKSGRTLQFIESPFLHFPGAFTTYDPTAKFLFSGDIFAALDTDWELVVDDFELHKMNMDLFHIDYMASNIAARGYVRRLDGITIEAILPQHGSIIDQENVINAFEYLENLRCGTDLIYSDL